MTFFESSVLFRKTAIQPGSSPGFFGRRNYGSPLGPCRIDIKHDPDDEQKVLRETHPCKPHAVPPLRLNQPSQLWPEPKLHRHRIVRRFIPPILLNQMTHGLAQDAEDRRKSERQQAKELQPG